MRNASNLLILSLSLALACARPPKGQPLSFADVDYYKYKEKSIPILNEIANTIDEPLWAGDYYAADLLGPDQRLTVAPATGYIYYCETDIAPCGDGEGAAEYDKGHLLLKGGWFNSTIMSNDMLLVQWSGRTYLIPSTKVVDFISSINQGEEPRRQKYGRWLLRKEDWLKPVFGKPGVPNEYKYLLK